MAALTRFLVFGFVFAWCAVWLRPAPAPRPELEIGYAAFVGRIEFDPATPTAVVLETPDGDVALLPNRFEGVVTWLGGREVEIEGLLLTIARTPILWIESVRVVGRRGERHPIRANPDRELEI